ncbi:radical SAM protein [Desulfamplus magnetovallimortis]|nr:radical SAM protein [Desulfamplus magnetovallimortis]
MIKTNLEYITDTNSNFEYLKIRPAGASYASDIARPLKHPLCLNQFNFSEINSFLLDLTTTCNAKCKFCYSSPYGRVSKFNNTDLLAIDEILHELAKHSLLKRIQIGCDFEPLISKDFHIIGKMFQQKFVDAPLIIVTNGVNLDKINIKDYAKAGGSKFILYVSMHAKNSDIYKSLVKGADFDLIINSVKKIRTDFPEITIQFDCVLTHQNSSDLTAYIQWAFCDLGVDLIEFRKVVIPDSNPALQKEIGLPYHVFLNLYESLKQNNLYEVGELNNSIVPESFWVKNRINIRTKLLREKIWQLKKNEEKFSNKFLEAEKKNSELQNSTCWRITKPIRFVGEKIKKLRNISNVHK